MTPCGMSHRCKPKPGSRAETSAEKFCCAKSKVSNTWDLHFVKRQQGKFKSCSRCVKINWNTTAMFAFNMSFYPADRGHTRVVKGHIHANKNNFISSASAASTSAIFLTKLRVCGGVMQKRQSEPSSRLSVNCSPSDSVNKWHKTLKGSRALVTVISNADRGGKENHTNM